MLRNDRQYRPVLWIVYRLETLIIKIPETPEERTYE
jgi:acyl-ACP thioesterase